MTEGTDLEGQRLRNMVLPITGAGLILIGAMAGLLTGKRLAPPAQPKIAVYSSESELHILINGTSVLRQVQNPQTGEMVQFVHNPEGGHPCISSLAGDPTRPGGVVVTRKSRASKGCRPTAGD